MNLESVVWPLEEVGALLEELAGGAGRAGRAGELDEKEFAFWVETAGARMGVEVEREEVAFGLLREKLRVAAPAVLRFAGGLMGLARVRGAKVELVGRNLERVRVGMSELEAVLRGPLEGPLRGDVEKMLGECGLAGSKLERAARAVLDEQLRDKRAATVWELRTPVGAGAWRQARETGLVGKMIVVAAAHGAEYVLWLAAWWVMGQKALSGRADVGWMMAWAMLVGTMIPLHMLSAWTQGLLAVGFGGLLRQRLLVGALRLDAGEIRREGAGLLLGRTLEAETVETLALSGGMASGLALLEVVMAVGVLWEGPGAGLGTMLFAASLGLAGWWTWTLFVRKREWTRRRLDMTHGLVENMSGHRTRLAQQREADWHAGEDREMEEYVAASAGMDKEWVKLTGVAPRVWLGAGIISLGPVFLSGSATAADLALGIGGVLLGYRALGRLTKGAGQLAGAWIAWEKVRDLFGAAARFESCGELVRAAEEEVVVEAKGVTYQHDGRRRAVLEEASVAVRRGDWILLEGASGGGKSTLGALLAGLRDPAAGLVLAGGLDRRTLGESAWRRMVALAPQYHENHILTGTFAFNLLMGRGWPPSEEDIREAEEICGELGLGPLLERMPGGLHQMVGETGWQLSQGERSRVFLARALLQGSRVVILDESLAALDPENLRRSLECAQKRAGTLVVVAHP